ncbi:MAG: response regulator transcription factor [Bacteroidales bacterium]|nr:response regulator transcription factor [Bacteroidales bacterium]
MKNQIAVIIVDDHTLFRNGLKILLNNFENIKIVGEASDGKEYLDKINTIKSDIVLMDINMPVMDGIEATKKSLEKFPDQKIIALSMYGDAEYYYKMIDAGVKGFLLKNSDITEVVDAIEKVNVGENYFSQELLYNVVKNINPAEKIKNQQIKLSKRELEVLEQICKGLSNQEIADVLSISKRTVDKHRANLLSKTQSKNTASLVMYAIENKLVDM